MATLPDESTLFTRRQETVVLALRFRAPPGRPETSRTRAQAWHDASWWLYLSWQDRQAQAVGEQVDESSWGWLKG